MATQNAAILRIIDMISAIGNGQIAIEPSLDTDLGYRALGYKDSAGNPYKVLVKGQSGVLKNLKLTDVSGNPGGAGFDANGNLIRISDAGDITFLDRGNWSPSATYALSEVVTFGSDRWVSRTTNTGSQPDVSPDDWTNLDVSVGFYIITDDTSLRAALNGPEEEKQAVWLATNPFELTGANYICDGDLTIHHSGLTLYGGAGGTATFSGNGRIQWVGSAIILDCNIDMVGAEMWVSLLNASDQELGGLWWVEGPYQDTWQNAVLGPLTAGGGSFVAGDQAAFFTSKQPGYEPGSPASLTHQGLRDAISQALLINLSTPGTPTATITQAQTAASAIVVSSAGLATDTNALTLNIGQNKARSFYVYKSGTAQLSITAGANTLLLPTGTVEGTLFVPAFNGSGMPNLQFTAVTGVTTVNTNDSTTVEFTGDGTSANPLVASVALNSIDSSYIQDNAVTTNKIADGAVTSAKIADGTIATVDIANNAVTLGKLATQAANTVLANATAATAIPTAFALGANTVLGRKAANIVAISLTDPEFVRYNRTALSDTTINNVTTYGEYGLFLDNSGTNTLTGANGPRGTGTYGGVFATFSEGALTSREYIQIYGDSTGTVFRGGTSGDTGTITWSAWASIGSSSVSSTTMGSTETYDFFLSEANLSASGSFGTRVAHWYRLPITAFLRVERIAYFMGQTGGTVRVALYKRTGTTGAVSLVWQSGDVSSTAGYNVVTVGTPGTFTPPNDQLWIGIMVPQAGGGSFSSMVGRNLNLSVIGPATLNPDAVTIFKETQASDNFPASFTPLASTPSFPSIIPHMFAAQVT